MTNIIFTFLALFYVGVSAQGYTNYEIPCEDQAKVFKTRVPPEEQTTEGAIYEFYQGFEMCLVNAHTLSEVLQVQYVMVDDKMEIRYTWVPVGLITINISHFDERQGCYVLTEFEKKN